MYPTLIELFGLQISSYGVSKALAALVAAWLLGRAFRRQGWDPELAQTMVLRAALLGFAGAKLYYLLEQLPSLSLHDLGGSGFTWYGGLLAGVASFWYDARRHRLDVGTVAGAAAIPLSIAYGVGRLGCLLAGDGTYGRPSDLPWAVAFPDGAVPTMVSVHPTPLYEAVAAFAIAAVLWRLRATIQPAALFGVYAILSGLARAAVETVRVNEPSLAGLTQPQLWSFALVAIGALLVVRHGSRATSAPVGGVHAEAVPVAERR